MSNVVKLNCKRYHFKCKVVTYTKQGKDENIIFEKALIVIEDSITKKTRVHEFTEFIVDNYRNIRVKSQVDYAGKIVRFLNYILDRRIKDNFILLDFYDIADFLEHVSLNSNSDTVMMYRRCLIKFYFHLASKKILVNVCCNDFSINEKEFNGRVINELEAPIPDFDMPPKKIKTRNTHSMGMNLQAMFLEVAFEEVNIIALGVFFQLFGGLRISEVINLTYSSLQSIGVLGKYGMMVSIKNNHLREDLKKNQGKGYVKKPRDQQIFSPFTMLQSYYSAHSKKYRKANSDAIFINADGKPMSEGSYRYYFMKLKRIFLERLSQSDNPTNKIQGLELSGKRWSTHIGRGLFTNNFAEIVMSTSELQRIRGDSSSETANIYIDDTETLGKRFEENAEETFRCLISKLKKS